MWEWQPFEKLTGVDTVVGLIDDHQARPFDDELKLVASAVPTRVHEFTAGRSLARLVLSRNGIRPQSILVGSAGQPIWPQGVAGSISHTNSHVGVALASCDQYRGIGLDIERAAGASRLDPALLLTEREREHLESGSSVSDATRIFCCKEAVFKAVFPITGEFFEFPDIEISFGDNGFRASMIDNSKSARVLAEGRGVIAEDRGLLASVFLCD